MTTDDGSNTFLSYRPVCFTQKEKEFHSMTGVTRYTSEQFPHISQRTDLPGGPTHSTPLIFSCGKPSDNGYKYTGESYFQFTISNDRLISQDVPHPYLSALFVFSFILSFVIIFTSCWCIRKNNPPAHITEINQQNEAEGLLPDKKDEQEPVFE